MRRGPLLGIAVFLACTIGGYKLGVHRREERLRRLQAELEREAEKAAAEATAAPASEPVAISTEALAVDLPSDVRRVESVPQVLE